MLLDLVVPDTEVHATFDGLHRLLDPSHVRTFTERALTDLLPGGRERLEYAHTATLRLPIDVAITEQSDADAVRALLEAELAGTGVPTGFDPERVDGSIVVSFTTTTVHARPG